VSDRSFKERSRARLPKIEKDVSERHVPLRMLSLTGGGYRGLFSASALVQLCDKAGLTGPLDDRVEIFAGTSIGGLMACALAIGTAPRRVLDAIDAHGPAIFVPRPLNRLRKLFSGAIYDSGKLSRAVRECLGDHSSRPIADVKAGLVVPAVNWSTGRVEIFTSSYLGAAHASTATLYDVCMSTSAAPTYFKPHKLEGSPMLDGGLVANNPDLVALTEISRRWPHALNRVEVLSIGTAGAQKLRIPAKADRSEMGWARSLVGFMIDVQEASAVAQASRLLGDRYVRVNHRPRTGEIAFERMDVADEEARTLLMSAGKRAAEEAYAEHQAFIDRFLSGIRRPAWRPSTA